MTPKADMPTKLETTPDEQPRSMRASMSAGFRSWNSPLTTPPTDTTRTVDAMDERAEGSWWVRNKHERRGDVWPWDMALRLFVNNDAFVWGPYLGASPTSLDAGADRAQEIRAEVLAAIRRTVDRASVRVSISAGVAWVHVSWAGGMSMPVWTVSLDPEDKRGIEELAAEVTRAECIRRESEADERRARFR